MLREIYDAPEGLTGEQILPRYNAKEIINMRVARLLDNNQVALRDAKYYVDNPMMLFILNAIVFMKLVILGKRSEFEKRG